MSTIRKACLFTLLAALFSACGSAGESPQRPPDPPPPPDGPPAPLGPCTQDSDCKCGTNIHTGRCEFGVSDIDERKQCPDFCSGISGMLRIVCKEGTCQSANAPPPTPAPAP